MNRDVYSGHLKLNGEEHHDTFIAANNYALSLGFSTALRRSKSLLRKTMPVARRILGESDDTHAQDEVELRAGALH